MGRKKVVSPKEAPSVALQTNAGNQERSETREPRYVVVREGHRVSPHEYSNPEDPKAIQEMEFWRTVANKHSWGEPVEIVVYDNKLHRVW
jgi:hypothetical protein